MPKRRFSPEQIIATLCQIEVQLGPGQKHPARLQRGRHLRTELRDECLKLGVFHSLKEAQVVVGAWRDHYNRVRPHSSLG